MGPRDCVTLSEYRRHVLKNRKQADIAKDAHCDQSWVSMVETGFLPARSSRTFETLVKAYGLIGQEDQFVRMVQNQIRLNALRKHVSEDFPLELFAKKQDDGMVVQIPSAELLKVAAPAVTEEARTA